MRALILDPPENPARLRRLPRRITAAARPADLILALVLSVRTVEADRVPDDGAYRTPPGRRRLSDAVRLWFAYPKRSGAIESDLDRDHGGQPPAAFDPLPVRQIALSGRPLPARHAEARAPVPVAGSPFLNSV